MYDRQQFYEPGNYFKPQQSGYFMNENYPPHQAHMNQNTHLYQEQLPSGTPFDYYSKPEQPNQWPMGMNQNYSNFYQGQYPQNNQGQAPSVLAQFQDENGKVSFDKVISTVNQLANTFQQVTPVIQQVSAMVKSFR